MSDRDLAAWRTQQEIIRRTDAQIRALTKQLAAIRATRGEARDLDNHHAEAVRILAALPLDPNAASHRAEAIQERHPRKATP